ncbi:MAG: hypothetical protein JWO36_252 [Myxococcales bacterium]|nr:hypothetical protein [Myxococcales bacterium]
MRGTARRIGEGTGPLVGYCELAVRQKRQRHAMEGKFELVDAEGNKTVVELPAASVLVDDERRAIYSKIAGEPGVSAIAMRPEPNIEVSLRTAWVTDGSSIDIVGERGDGTVKWMAAGTQQAVDTWETAHAKEQQRRQAPLKRGALPWNVIIPLALVLVTIVLAEASITLGTSAFTFIAPTIAITTAAVAVGLLWDQIQLPKFDEREKKPTRLLAAGAVVMGIAVNLPPEGPMGTTIQGALILAVGVFGLVRSRRQIRLLGRLIQPTSEPQEGKPGVFVGRVGDETPEKFFSQMIAIGAIHTLRKKKLESDKSLDQNVEKSIERNLDNKVATERRGFDSMFQLHLANSSLDVDPKGATWSSEHRNKRETWSVFLPIDAAVVIAGTPQREGKKLQLKATAPDSLVIYGVQGGDDPQDSLRRKLVLHKLTYGALSMVIALAVALAIHGYIAAS